MIWIEWDAAAYSPQLPRPFRDDDLIEVELRHGGRNVMFGADVCLSADSLQCADPKYHGIRDLIRYRRIDPASVMDKSELRSIRKRLGMTQAQFGEAIGVSGAFVGEMERGEKRLEKRTIMAVRYLVGKEAN